VSAEVRKRAISTGERVSILVTRLLTATFLAAFVGAIENWFYERFFAPDLYAAGPVFARGVFMVLVTFPFILAALILLGLPTAYVLRRLRAENAFTYALAGAMAGALWASTVFGPITTLGVGTCAFYGLTCALAWWWLRPRS
jgi:hypothetical protein